MLTVGDGSGNSEGFIVDKMIDELFGKAGGWTDPPEKLGPPAPHVCAFCGKKPEGWFIQIPDGVDERVWRNDDCFGRRRVLEGELHSRWAI